MPAASSVLLSCSCCLASAPPANELPSQAASFGNMGLRARAMGDASARLYPYAAMRPTFSSAWMRPKTAAGMWRTSPASVQGYRLMGAVLLAVLALWCAASAAWSPFVAVIVAGYGCAVGWISPMFLIKSRARRRTDQIEVELPELIDRLIVTLEAGIGFNAALQRSGERMSGPLGEELRLTLHEHELGLTMPAALSNLLVRCNVPSIRAFVRSVTQSEQLGISIGHVMRELATDIRKRRRQILEEKAQKAPIKMLFPLAFLILPAQLLVIHFPGVYNIITSLGANA